MESKLDEENKIEENDDVIVDDTSVESEGEAEETLPDEEVELSDSVEDESDLKLEDGCDEEGEEDSSENDSYGEREDTGDEPEGKEEKLADEDSEDVEGGEGESDADNENDENENADKESDGEIKDGEEDSEEDDENDEEEDPRDSIDVPLENIVEALLISASEPRSVKQLAKSAGKRVKKNDIEEAIEKLSAYYSESGRAFEIVKINDAYQIMTCPEYSAFVATVVKKNTETKKLTPAMLDTLAIVAYRQPIMRVDVETIRGVGCGQVLRALIEAEMVKIVGKKTDIPGQPMLYGTTDKFLESFGVGSVEELPSIQQLRKG
jgi:segregation and condensation protein B